MRGRNAEIDFNCFGDLTSSSFFNRKTAYRTYITHGLDYTIHRYPWVYVLSKKVWKKVIIEKLFHIYSLPSAPVFSKFKLTLSPPPQLRNNIEIKVSVSLQARWRGTTMRYSCYDRTVAQVSWARRSPVRAVVRRGYVGRREIIRTLPTVRNKQVKSSTVVGMQPQEGTYIRTRNTVRV